MGKIGFITAGISAAAFGLLAMAADVKAQQQAGSGETTYFGTEGESFRQRLGQRFGAQGMHSQQYSPGYTGQMGQMMQQQPQFGQPQQFGQIGGYGQQQQPQQFGQMGWGQQQPQQFGQLGQQQEEKEKE